MKILCWQYLYSKFIYAINFHWHENLCIIEYEKSRVFANCHTVIHLIAAEIMSISPHSLTSAKFKITDGYIFAFIQCTNACLHILIAN